MRVQSLLIVLAGLSLAYGCHTIAGVRTDGILETEDAGPGSSSSSTASTGGMGGTGGASSAGGAGGTGGGGCNPDNCLSKMCDQNACVPVNAQCTPNGAQ